MILFYYNEKEIFIDYFEFKHCTRENLGKFVKLEKINFNLSLYPFYKYLEGLRHGMSGQSR